MDSHESKKFERECLFCKRSKSECTCLGSCSCPKNAPPLSSCMFYSPRIQGLYEGEMSESETTQEHWTLENRKKMKEVKRVGKENRKYFMEKLVKHSTWGTFFTEFQDLKLGRKIGEGGQAEIFAARTDDDSHLAAKIFKNDVSLKDLEQQWPCEMREGTYFRYRIKGGVLIRDGEYKNRFAFVMRKKWGDLRTLIDQRMVELLRTNNHGPPFNDVAIIFMIIADVIFNIVRMHEEGVVHRDIKASNVLIDGVSGWASQMPSLVDFECSLGTSGTRFWRAPEILEQVQRRVPSQELVFTKEADIYSFGMFCYEMIMGCIPFEDQPQNDYSGVLRGERPRLPDELNCHLRELVLSCWQHNPQDRPSAQMIYDKFGSPLISFGLTYREF